MSWLTKVVRAATAPRRREIRRFMAHPVEVQREQLHDLVGRAAETVFGKEHGFASIRTPEQFARQVPVTDYDAFCGYIERVRQGEQQVVWPTPIRWFAKSSGTTSAKSKFIPVSEEGLRRCHMRGPKDIVALFSDLYPESRVFSGKTLTLGGSHRLVRSDGVAQEGDLSAILIENTPCIASRFRVPKVETALIPDFEQKVDAICRETVSQRVTAFAGVPSWNLVMLKKVLEYTGKNNILEVWPHMELFTHGGMNFEPYREEYRRIFPSSQMKYMNTYNASEGFFGIQNDPSADDMLLMLDYGVYYEFLPMKDLNDPSKCVPLEGVVRGENYAMIITTCNGLWRYMIGDTVEFTSLAPYKIRITGRTRHFINAFGEEVIVDNADRALQAACQATGAQIADYTAGPIYMTEGRKGSHQWVIEFQVPPSDPERFTDVLDRTLQQVNSDYEAKRFKDTTLLRPTVTLVPQGTFYAWMKRRGKIGGQNKVPRLSNDRTYIEQLLDQNERSV